MSVDLFDANFYRAANPDLAAAGLSTDTQLLSHFQNNGIDEGRLLSPFANLNFYRSSNPDLAAAGLNSNRQAFNHLQNNGVAEGRRFGEFVDINYYLTVNPDVSQAFGGNRERSLEHLRSFGVNEGRSFSPFVDLDYYLSTNSDLNQAFGGNRERSLEHLEIFGLSEGRQFSPAFNVNFYRNKYSDLSNAGLTTNRSLFQHWVLYGSDQRSGAPDPGNSLDTALNLGSPATSATGFNDFVGSSDSDDYYRFSLNESRNIVVELTGLSANLDLELLDYSGSYLLHSTSFGSTTKSVSYFSLNPGTYYIRVSQGGTSASSNYNLSVSHLPAQDPGNTLSTAYPLNDGVVPPFNIGIVDSVGGSDTDDYYKLTLTQNASFGAGGGPSYPYTENIDLYLLNSSGATIDSSTNSGSTTDSFGAILNAGTYYVRVRGFSSSTDYSLFLGTSSV